MNVQEFKALLSAALEDPAIRTQVAAAVSEALRAGVELPCPLPQELPARIEQLAVEAVRREIARGALKC